MQFASIYLTIILDVTDLELGLVDSLFDISYSNFPSSKGSDRMRWALTSDGEFDVSSYLEALRGMREMMFPWKSIWCAKATKRVSSFVWTAAWGKIPTGDHLIM